MKTEQAFSAPDPRIAFFDRQADTWDAEQPQALIARLESLRRLLALRPGERLLEVGCGTGNITRWLQRQVSPGRVTAIDFSPRMLEKARRKGIDAEFVHLDICCERPEREVYDIILCFHSFPHFRDQRAALRNLAYALRPTGRMVVVHLAGSAQINAFHAGLGGAVAD